MKRLGLLILLSLMIFTYAQDPVSLIVAARKQIGVTKSYDPAYVTLAYPNGDLPIERGVCTDVVIRAMRENDIDLQKEVHEDMKINFSTHILRIAAGLETLHTAFERQWGSCPSCDSMPSILRTLRLVWMKVWVYSHLPLLLVCLSACP